jgi:hypothetical protein
MRAFWAAVSLVNGANGGRDMLASDVGEAPNLLPHFDMSMACCLSADS